MSLTALYDHLITLKMSFCIILYELNILNDLTIFLFVGSLSHDSITEGKTLPPRPPLPIPLKQFFTWSYPRHVNFICT